MKMDARERKVIQILKGLPTKGGRILDIGCGDGRLSLMFKEALNGEDIYGIDISEELLRAAATRGIKTFKVDINQGAFPFETNFFDVIIASEVLEHCILPDELFKEVHRLLKSKGYFILTTPNLASFYDRFLLLFGYEPLCHEPSYKFPDAGKALRFLFREGQQSRQRQKFEGDPGHIRCMSYKATLELLNLFGFRVKRVIPYNWSHSSVKLPVKVLTILLDRIATFIPGFAVEYI